MFLKVCKDVYIYTLVTVTVYIYTITVARPFIILLISCSHLFFSLFSPCTTNSITSPRLVFFFLRCTQTHPHTNTSTQINQHRDTQTNPHKQTNEETDRCLIETIGACGTIDAWLERSMLVGLTWLVLVGLVWLEFVCLAWSELVHLAWSVLDRVWSKLVGLTWSELVGLAWSELGRSDWKDVDYTERESWSMFINGDRDGYRERATN